MIRIDKFLIFFLGIFICFFLINKECSAYTIPVQTLNASVDSASNSTYTLEKSVICEFTDDTSKNASYTLISGYLPYIESNFDAARAELIGQKGRRTYRNTFAPDSIIVAVYDYDNMPVKEEFVNFVIMDKPSNSSGETVFFTLTNDSGLSYANFKSGNKTGAYIVRAEFSDFFRDYIGFHTDEYELPAKEWKMIGVNKTPANPDLNFTFSGVKPDFIYHWNPDVEDDEFDKKFREVNTVKSGEGYFVIMPDVTTLQLNGTLKNDTQILQLKTGWNQIASPFYYITAWNSARVITENGIKLDPAAAQSQNYIENKIYWYKDNNYLWGPNSSIPDPLLYVWSGFWVYAKKNCALQLSPDFSYNETNRINLAPKKGNSDNWEMIVSVIGNNSSDLLNYFGASMTSENGLESSDAKKAPAVSDIISAGFSSGQYLASDMRKGPIQTAEVWNFDVYTGKNTEYSLKFDGILNIGDNQDVFLIDDNTKNYYNIREKSDFTFISTKYKKNSFKIVAGKPEFVRAYLAPPLAKEVTYARPNPGPDQASGLITFIYSVPGNGALSLKIFDLAGIKVCEKNLDVNANQYQWDCKNDSGKSVRTGVYLYKMEYSGTTGKYKMTDKLAIVR